MAWIKNCGKEYEVSVYAYFKVAMAKRTDEEEISEQAFDATCRIYDNVSDVTVVDNDVMEVKQDNKHFTFADVGLDLRIKVTAHGYEKAYEQAEKIAQEEAHLAAGVAFFACEAYDYETDGEQQIMIIGA